MGKVNVELNTEEAHILELAINYRLQHLPDKTPKEREMMEELVRKLNKAYIDDDWQDFKANHLS